MAVILFSFWLSVALSATAQVYKTTDEDGNVIFTDKAPSATSEPMDLPGLSVISPAEPVGIPEPVDQVDEEDPAEAVTDIRELRRGYSDFTLTSPQSEETFWGTGNRVLATWSTGHRLQQGMQVTFVVNGETRPPTTAESIVISDLDRGTHVVSAELRDERQRLVARADQVTFFVQQNSANFNRSPPRPSPAGGG
jgi:hypothetical protein